MWHVIHLLHNILIKKTWNVDDIISTFEVNDLEFLSPILWIMNQPQEIMTWDEKSGEIVYMQHRIRGSNIIKLLKTTCAGQMNALGIVQFCRRLIILNVPKNVFKTPNETNIGIIEIIPIHFCTYMLKKHHHQIIALHPSIGKNRR